MEDADLATRVLKRGDLVRVNSKKQGKIKDHHGDLGRIVRVTPVGPTMENSHPFVYDMDLVLGGKLKGVFRSDLLYTTATQEGMTGDSQRRRKRKTPSLDGDAEETPKKEAAKPKKKKTTGAKRGRPPANKANGTKATTKKKSTEPKVVKKTSDLAAADIASQTIDLYERHQRDFEKAINRLEKADAYNFFGSEVPPEFVETYIKDDVEKDASEMENGATTSNDGTSATAQHNEMDASEQSPNPSKPKGKPKIKFPSNPPYNFVVIRERMKHDRYVTDRVRLENDQRIELLTPYFKSIGRKNPTRRPRKSAIAVLNKKGVNWELFKQDVIGMCDAAVNRNEELGDKGPGTLFHTAQKIKEILEQLYERFGVRHNAEMAGANDRHRFLLAMDKGGNTEAAMQGKWKRDAFPERQYEKLEEDAVCSGLSELDERIASYELRTTLKDSFIGLAYTYDDTGQSEGWMKSALDVAEDQSAQRKAALALASDDGVIRAQVEATMQKLIIGVQDKVMTQAGVLEQTELRSANWDLETQKVAEQVVTTSGIGTEAAPEIVEQPVWGIDCYTRKNIFLCLESEFDSDTILTFVEKWLLPAINACPVDLAYELSNALRILEGLEFDTSTSLDIDNSSTLEQWKTTLLGKALVNKIAKSGPPWLSSMANILRRAKKSLGPDFFRVHPKGHGSIVLCEKLEPNRLVTFYRGEVYPSWRWGEKIDAIASTQEKKGLKPVLPDFFNMALERPQKDPRGYGLLFVDASRRSGYGSMLSHSCEPSCEVVCTAVNGELRLAMTTLREISMGDELTFDYNAVTESLVEYQSAVCLCGYGKCRGSFLHFATADCYQQVLNRNAPIAVRFANLVKGSTKQVMSEDDDRILKKHGFQTAVFGAISVNRRKADILDTMNLSLDTMNIVPVWLRTYVADVLRYVEYERCALPIALLCNEMMDSDENDKKRGSSVPSRGQKEDSKNASDNDEKPIKGAKPEPTFFFYARKKREHFVSLLVQDDDKKTLAGSELKREVQKLASSHWKELDPQTKERWKSKALKDWEKNGGKEKAKLEEQRLKRLSKAGAKGSTSKKDSKNSKSSDTSKAQKDSGRGNQLGGKRKQKISFQQADAEGLSAMEQRIQQLTQTLSRVGRVLDRHREAILTNGEKASIESESDESLREVVHSPLSILPEEAIVGWMWNHESGVVRQLLSYAKTEICVSPSLRTTLEETVSKFQPLEMFGRPWEAPVPQDLLPMSASEGRALLNEAMLELRQNLLDGIQNMATEIKKQKASTRKEMPKKKKDNKVATKSQSASEPQEASTCSTLDESGTPSEASPLDQNISESSRPNSPSNGEGDSSTELSPWLQNYNKRFKLQKAADLLLMYARTGNFFTMRPYRPLQSSKVEVYARELGRSVPVTAIDKEVEGQSFSAPPLRQQGNSSTTQNDAEGTTKSARKPKRKICDPEDVVSNVVVEYQGDFVLSQLLQWYNAGLGQKAGLPDLVGCVLLPSMKGCWTVDSTSVVNSHTDRATKYHSSTRRRLIEWLKDPLKRGNPWSDEIRKAFVENEEDIMVSDASNVWLPLGSPVLDLLVTGDDMNLNAVVATMASSYSSMLSRGASAADGILSTVDEGRPAQAVSNWIQCDNPDCQKWRKVPWNIDIDTLSENFHCKDNVWNPTSASCDAPEDEWDETAEAQVGADGSAVITKTVDVGKKDTLISSSDSGSFKLTDFRLGARFDVLREETNAWSVATVIKVDLGGASKRVKVHYSKMQVKHDEWIDVYSPRFAALHSRVPKMEKKAQKKKTQARRVKDKGETIKQRKKVVLETKSPSVEESGNSSPATEKSTTSVEESTRNEDSLMEGVFFQDSEDEGTNSDKVSTSIGEGESRASSPNGASDDMDEILRDSDDEKAADMESVSVEGKDKVSDAGGQDSVAPKLPTWKIPKKVATPEKVRLVPHQNDFEASSSQKENSGTNRIPRKKIPRTDVPAASLIGLGVVEEKSSQSTTGREKETSNTAKNLDTRDGNLHGQRAEQASPASNDIGRNRGFGNTRSPASSQGYNGPSHRNVRDYRADNQYRHGSDFNRRVENGNGTNDFARREASPRSKHDAGRRDRNDEGPMERNRHYSRDDSMPQYDRSYAEDYPRFPRNDEGHYRYHDESARDRPYDSYDSGRYYDTSRYYDRDYYDNQYYDEGRRWDRRPEGSERDRYRYDYGPGDYYDDSSRRDYSGYYDDYSPDKHRRRYHEADRGSRREGSSKEYHREKKRRRHDRDFDSPKHRKSKTSSHTPRKEKEVPSPVSAQRPQESLESHTQNTDRK